MGKQIRKTQKLFIKYRKWRGGKTKIDTRPGGLYHDYMPGNGPARKGLLLTDGTISLRPPLFKDIKAVHTSARESLADMFPWMPWAHKDYSVKESRFWLKSRPEAWKNGAEYDFAIVDARDGSFLGGCGLNNIDHPNRTANLGYWVRSSRAGRGIAPAATLLLAGWGFKELRLNRIEIKMATGNVRSQRVAEKVGARREGIMRDRFLLYGRAYDAMLYSLLPADLDNRFPKE
jgi:ribosomal-protein-serine acetyltransferase